MLATLVPILLVTAQALDSPFRYVKQTVRIESFQNCPRTNYSARLNDVQIVQVNKTTFVVNSVINIPKGLLSIPQPKGRFTLKRCRSRDDKNLCEYYMGFNVTDICERIKQDGQAWSGLVKALDPSLLCPFDKGTEVLYKEIVGSDGESTGKRSLWDETVKLGISNKRTTYVQTNGTMDAGIVGKVTPEGFVWTYQLEIFNRDSIVFCHEGSYQIQRVKEIEEVVKSQI
ncbi:hypothetical protein AAG570_003548 [Ranatra chinensis]|uniref:Uncharacterized protein n=1 Tax=Ranatra chinensis TaxID=642074 RepID=A0ABD0YM09_9HEMI